MKLNKEQISEIKKLRESGLSSYRLAKQFNVSQATIFYHTSLEHKEKRSYKNRKEYYKKYQRERYKNDEVFRNKHKEAMKKYKDKVQALKALKNEQTNNL